MSQINALRLAIDGRGMKAGAAEAVKATDDVSKGATKATKQLRGLDGQFKKTSKAGMAMKRMLAGAFAGVTIGLMAKSVIGLNAQFEFTIATLQGVTKTADQSSKAFQDMIKQARTLGATTKFSAKEAAEGQLFLARAGLKANEIMAALPGTLDLAAAGNIALGESADIASNVMSQFRLKAEDMNKVGDVLISTANSANTDVRQLAEALKFAGPIAGALGISLEQTAAAAGVLGDSGIQASLAGTNLRGIMSTLIKPTKEALGVIDRMGISMKDLDPTTNSLTDIIQQFANANLSAADATAIFQKRNAGAALALTANITKMKELAEANKVSAGEAKRNADIMNDTLIGAWLGLKSAIQEAMLQLGDKGLTSGLKNLVIFLTNVVRVLTGMEEHVDENAKLARRFAEAIKILTVALGTFLALKLAVQLGAMAGGVGKVTKAVKVLTLAMAANPVGAVIIAITTVSALLFSLRNKMITIGDTTFSVGDVVLSVWEHMIDKFKFMGELIMKSWAFVWSTVQESFVNTWTNIKTFASAIFSFLDLDWRRIMNGILDVAKLIGNSIIGVFVAIGKTIAVIVGRIMAVGNAFKDFDITDPATIFQVGENLKQALDPTTLVSDIQTKILSAFGPDYIARMTKAGKGLGQGIMDGVSLVLGRDATDDFLRFFTPGGALADIAARIKEKADARAAANAPTASGMSTEGIFVGPHPDDLKRISAEMLNVADAAEKLAAVKLPEAVLSARGEFNQLLPALLEERELIGLTSDSRERAIFLIEAERLAKAGLIEDSEKLILQLEREFEANQKLTETKRIADSAAQSFTDAFEAILTGSANAADAIRNLAEELYKLALQELVLAPFKNALSGFFQSFGGGGGDTPAEALGGLWRGGVKQFGDGGITNGPELFPTAQGVGVRGERGPEAIVPLPNGRSIPVEMRGGGGGSQQVLNLHQTIVVKANNIDEFKQSKRELARAGSTAMRDAWKGR